MNRFVLIEGGSDRLQTKATRTTEMTVKKRLVSPWGETRLFRASTE